MRTGFSFVRCKHPGEDGGDCGMTVAEVLRPLCPQIPVSKPEDHGLGMVPGLRGSVMGLQERSWGQGPQDVISALVSRDPESSLHTRPPTRENACEGNSCLGTREGPHRLA